MQVTATSGDQSADFSWKFAAEPSHPDRAFLTELVDAARRDRGLTLPTVGSQGLVETARLIGARVDQLTMLAERAVATGDRAGARRFAQAVLRAEPHNVRARTVQNVVDESDPFSFEDDGDDFFGETTEEVPAEESPAEDAAAEQVPAEEAPADEASEDLFPAEAPAAEAPTVEAPAAAAPSEAAPAADAPIELVRPAPAAGGDDLSRQGGDGAFLAEVEQERRVFAEMLAREVETIVLDARSRMTTEPELVIQELKLSLDNVKKAADLDEARRAEMVDKLEFALREAARQSDIKDELDRQREEQLAVARERQFLNERLIRRLDREKQLMDRFNALMDERRFIESQEVAQIVEDIDPNGVTPRAAQLWSRATEHYYLQQVVRSARHKATWDTLYQVELSHIPFPDSPPIVYPEASVWEELTNRRKKYAAVDLGSTGEAEQRIEEALRSQLRAPLEFVETPLNAIMEIISEEYGIQIVLDNSALDALAISPDTEVTVNLRSISLRSALELMLKSPATEDLTYIIDNEVLLITSQDEADARLTVKVYPVADLVLPIQNLGLIGGVGGGGGGLGGGGGGLGGGGGGFGGGGGGFGGGGGGGFGGGGGGGGGFFTVPDALEDLDAQSNPQKLLTLDVGLSTADTNDADSQNPSSRKPSDENADSQADRQIDAAGEIAVDSSQSPTDFWNGYFAAERRDPAVVRDAVRDLMKRRQHQHTIALIEAALRNGQPQSWMYESLGIAMELAGSPKSDIERAVMSACDFSDDPDQLLMIGSYLAHIGLDQRAVDVYRQVAKAEPLQHEAYALGLRAAQRCQDVDAIRWATLGILRQAWQDDQAIVRNTAFRVAKATLDQMRSEGNTAAADQYEQDLNNALIRDCLVRVSWSGDADVDLYVEEPGGTVCSLRAPRTPGGGVCLGDAYASDEDPGDDGLSETYVCSRGFSGEYRVRIRKVWGEVVAGKVAVDIYRNYRSKNEQHQRQYVNVGEDDSLVLFTLDQGRRADPIGEQQLAAAVERQQQISRAVLAQQIGSLGDPSIIPDRAAVRGLDLRRQLALAGRGAVGFQPVIITLPEGTQMIATGVISADRRYVRITAAPSFTGIGDVTTFTFAGAAAPTDTGDGGGGGGGGGGAGGGGVGGGGAGGGGGF